MKLIPSLLKACCNVEKSVINRSTTLSLNHHVNILTYVFELLFNKVVNSNTDYQELLSLIFSLTVSLIEFYTTINSEFDSSRNFICSVSAFSVSKSLNNFFVFLSHKDHESVNFLQSFLIDHVINGTQFGCLVVLLPLISLISASKCSKLIELSTLLISSNWDFLVKIKPTFSLENELVRVSELFVSVIHYSSFEILYHILINITDFIPRDLFSVYLPLVWSNLHQFSFLPSHC
ncbi:hypothetical protein RCL1_000202 [Eukaryota sp. TZLM3-RCL]